MVELESGEQKDDSATNGVQLVTNSPDSTSNCVRARRTSIFKPLRPLVDVSQLPFILVTDEHEEFEAKARNKLMRYEFKKDEEYTGEVAENKAHGHGVLLYKDCKFGGLWDSGYECIGCYIWPNNVRYSGFWSKGRRNGEGVEQHKNYFYKGEWVEDLKEGYGVIASHTGSKYEGTWHKDLQEGCGIETYRDGSFYAGQFDAGLRSGYGVKIDNPTDQHRRVFTGLVTENGTSREGGAAGETQQKPATGETQQKPATNPLMSALEVMTSLDNLRLSQPGEKVTTIYMGQWKDDARNGFGMEKNSKGEAFRGTFKDNKKQGQGVLKDQLGLEHHGKWSKNVCKVNKRILTSAAQRSAMSGEEAAKLAKEKAALSRGRAIGARKCALEATDSEARANEQFLIAQERRAETLNQIRLGNISINVVSTEQNKPASPGGTLQINLAKQAKDLRSKLSDMTSNMVKSPKLGRKSAAGTISNPQSIDTKSITPNSSTNSSPKLKNSKTARPDTHQIT
ncbi:hypothetical protein ACHWQZ_G000173 [Mnemiopsis leidyi]